MTPSRYLLARIAQSFGYVRKTHRMSEAAAESLLLSEAETHLGISVWPHVESIDELKEVYGSLRKLIKERDALNQKVSECQQQLDSFHMERAELSNGPPEQNDELMRSRMACTERLDQLAHQRDRLVSEARDARRNYMDTKSKLEIIREESQGKSLSADELKEVEDINSQLADIRQRFEELKEMRANTGEQIEKGERALNEVEEKLEALRHERNEKAAAAFHMIGEMNKVLHQLRAERGALDTKMNQLYCDIGKHVSLNAKSDPKCAAAVQKQQALVTIMKALRRSVELNLKLAGSDS